MPDWKGVAPWGQCGDGTIEAQACYGRAVPTNRFRMIKLALVFLAVALIAGIFGLTGIAGAAVDIAMFLFVAALVIFVLLLVLGFTIFKKVT